MDRLELIDKEKYIFTKDGIWSKYYKKMLNGVVNSNGYIRVSLNCIDGKKRRFYYHRVMAYMFIPNPDNKHFVDHINGNRQDNRIENLRWCTQKENNNFEPYRKSQKDSSKNKAVCQYDLDGNLINTYKSIHQASRETGVNRCNISSCCGGNNKTANGFIWRFKKG